MTSYERIAAFGASVTQQENGYADFLAKKLGKKIKKFGYGGMHLPDAGMCFLDKVVSYKPDLVFIDWFSTDFMEQSEKTCRCIDTILYKFSLIKCAVVFLIFPERRNDGKQKDKDLFYDFCRNEIKKRSAYYIDLDKELKNQDLSDILRDSIHTTIHGGGATQKRLATICKQTFQMCFLRKNSKEMLSIKMFVG